MLETVNPSRAFLAIDWPPVGGLELPSRGEPIHYSRPTRLPVLFAATIVGHRRAKTLLDRYHDRA